MNELQIKLTGDITALVSAINKAKATIKSFESETEKESEKGNVGFKRKIGLIEQLTNKAKQLRVALSQATNEKQIEQYNQELEQTVKEMTRLNALGRQVTASLGSTAGGFGKVTNQGKGAIGVTQEFNRIIQDAPFGLIGIGNNLQQLASNFSVLKYQAGSTGKAVGLALTSIISPINLGLLAVSALTAGFTAYQMGAFDSILATDSAKESLDDYRESLDAVTRSLIEGESQAQSEIQSFQLLKLQAENANIPLKDRLEAVKDLKDQYPEYLQGLTDEQILTGNVGVAYENLSKQIIATAKARAASDLIADNSLKLLTLEERTAKRALDILKARDEFAKAQESVYDVGEIEIIKEINDLIQDQINDIDEINRLKEEEIKLTDQINSQIEQGARFTDEETKAVKDQLLTYEEKEEAILKALRAQLKFNEATDPANQFAKATSRLTGEEGEDPVANAIADAQAKIAQSLAQMGPPVKEYAAEAGKIKDINLSIADSFSALSTAIVASFDIQNDALKGFVTTLVSNAPKIVSAIIKTAQANKQASELGIESAKKGALANGIFMATESGKALGPIGLALLPVLIGGAFALISSAFSKSGNGGAVGGGGGAVASSGAPPQIFTNAKTVSPPNATGPNYNPGNDIDWSKAQGRLFVDIEFDKLRFGLDMASERKQSGG